MTGKPAAVHWFSYAVHLIWSHKYEGFTFSIIWYDVLMYSSSGARVWNQRIWMCFNPENFLFWCVCVCECIYVCVMCVWVYTRECDVCVTMCMCVMCVCVRMYRIYPNIACKLASFLLLHPHECWGCQLSHHPQSSLASHEARWIHVKRKGVVVKIQTFQYLLCSKMSFFF